MYALLQYCHRDTADMSFCVGLNILDLGSSFSLTLWGDGGDVCDVHKFVDPCERAEESVSY